MNLARLSGATAACRIAAIVAGAVAFAALSASAATAQPSIEGVWTFNGGAVLIAPSPSGEIVGTVTTPTTFGPCQHPVGQEMWTELTATPNGEYTGYHQWYRGGASRCEMITPLGPTAFRVLSEGNGTSVLRVCFNHPGTTMPVIAPDGTPSNVNYGCDDSQPVAGVPTAVPSFNQTIILPSATTRPGNVCRSLRHFAIHIREPHNDPFVKLTVFLGHRVFRTFRRGDEITATINLRGLPKGTYTVRIRARTAAGFIVKGWRTYHTCVPKRLSKKH